MHGVLITKTGENTVSRYGMSVPVKCPARVRASCCWSCGWAGVVFSCEFLGENYIVISSAR